MSELFRHVPSVDAALTALEAEMRDAVKGPRALPRPLVRDLVNEFFQRCREDVRAGRITEASELSLPALLPALAGFVRAGGRTHFRRVLNATGVVVHTNLGRSLLCEEAIRAVAESCAHYSNLEFDLDTGERGSRYSHVRDLLCRLTGAEDALVVNNNAAAVFLVLDTLARGREVVVSRGQLVEIGGSFRIPDVMARSGAILREVGTTNRTHLSDYEQAVNPSTAALMRVHASNFRVIGFTSEVPLKDLRVLADKHNLLVIEDLGSGNLCEFPAPGLASEPPVQSVVAQGADVVSFSGDKVLGGPQAGLIVGRREAIARIKGNPLNRALRIDKMTLAALEATLRLYLDPEQAKARIPTLRMIGLTEAGLKSQAGRLARLVRSALGRDLAVSTRKGVSRVGGGAFPERDLPTTLVALSPKRPVGLEALRKALLATDPPLVGRVEADALCLDPRTLGQGEHALAVRALAQAVQSVKDGAGGPRKRERSRT